MKRMADVRGHDPRVPTWRPTWSDRYPAGLPRPPGTSPPTRVSIPSIGVDSSLESLGLLANGELQPPTEWQQAGWYADGIVPGGTGPAVIIGHVDSMSGPAVFFRLGDLRVGDPVLAKRKDGSTLRFVVEAMRSYPKDHFPTTAVYGPTRCRSCD